MPFMGRDWRSPGEAWVKTESLGWQRVKLIEAQLHPNSCQATPLTCSSWPPRSDFGQHMEQHCEFNKQQISDKVCHSPGTDSNGSCCSSRGSYSSDTSPRDGSESPSLNSSPEKIAIAPSVIVSSPYGQYSCCAHHFESTPGSPKSSRLKFSGERADSKPTTQQSIPRSLSRNLSLGSKVDGSMLCSSLTDLRVFDGHGSNYCRGRNEREINGKENRAYSADTERTDKENVAGGGQESAGSGTNYSTVTYLPHESNQTACVNSKSCCFCCSQNRPRLTGGSFLKTAPHCRISIKTREVAMYNTISEAFYRLDFCNAIHDIRRFNYICKLLHLLITQNLTSLSGCATKVLFTMLEQVAWEVSSNKRNIHVLKNLLNELKSMLQKYYCWGRPIGSSLLWQQHFDTIERISQIVDGIELAPPKNETGKGVTFNSLPVEMVREILLRLNDYRDLINSSQASPVMENMINGQYVWKKLCRYHFTKEQLKVAFESYNSSICGKQGSRNNRNIKYARTTSADGRVSYRNPISHNRAKVSAEQQGNKSSVNSQEVNDGQCSSNHRDPKRDDSSYVSRAIRIFDKERAADGATSKEIKMDTVSSAGQRRGRQRANVYQNSATEKKQLEQKGYHHQSASRDIDWERVFHHLRKKFDLKEEYADCLLLCRRCKCLFWKSFGHPCIRGEENPTNEDQGPTGECKLDEHRQQALGRRADSNNQAEMDRGSSSRQIRRHPLRQFHQNGNERGEQRRAPPADPLEGPAQSRPSVAALSRSFDSRTEAPAGSARRGSSARPDDWMGAGLRDQRDDIVPRGRSSTSCARSGEQVSRASQPGSGANTNRARIRVAVDRGDELVPKHVAISPQAFLKFFSL